MIAASEQKAKDAERQHVEVDQEVVRLRVTEAQLKQEVTHVSFFMIRFPLKLC